MNYHNIYLAVTYNSGAYGSSTYAGQATTGTTSSGTSSAGGTTATGGVLTNTGFDIAASVTIACVIIFASLMVRLWKRPAAVKVESEE